MRSAMDLENSFGPAYARGMMLKGQSAWAVIGAGPDEPQATIDGILTLAVLWLCWCREHGEGRRLFEGVRVVVPAGSAATTRTRMAWMNAALAKWELYELDANTEALTRIDLADQGNLRTVLLQAFDPKRALERAGSTIGHVLTLLPEGMREVIEVRPVSPAEISLMLYGLEFARVRYGSAHSFHRASAVTFGAGVNEMPLDAATEPLFRELTHRLFAHRRPGSNVRDPLYRLQPERWLESELRRSLELLDDHLRLGQLYAQVPSFTSGERGLLDLLAVDRGGRLAVLELKANEDLHLPLQALDYWIRVRKVNLAGELAAAGYFPGVHLSSAAPLLYLVAPALRIHPANYAVLRFLSPAVEWTLMALDEQWRRRMKVVWRKRRADIV